MSTKPTGTPCTVQQLAHLTADQIWKLKGRFLVTFDDGVTLPLGSRHIKLSWPYWGITRHYGQVKINSTLCYRRGEKAKDKKHKDLMSLAFQEAKKYPEISIKDVRLLIYRSIYAEAYNQTVSRQLKYMTTIDIDAFIEMLSHPLIAKAVSYADRYPEGIDDEGRDMVEVAYCLIEEAISSEELSNNPVVQSIQDGTIKLDQALQAFIRGKCSEINSAVYDVPVWDGFVTGILSIIGILKESRAPARSNVFNTDNIADSEYGSRKFQLICNILFGSRDGDCGTAHFHRQTFNDTAEDKVTLERMRGNYFRFDASTKWQPITDENIPSILGREIQYRSTMCCKHLAEQSVCRVCYGDLFYSLSEDAAPGHLSTTDISAQGSQGILSTKHLDFLRKVLSMLLRTQMMSYFDLHAQGQTKGISLLKHPAFFESWDNYSIRIPREVHHHLEVVRFERNLKNLDLSAIVDVSEVAFVVKDSNGEVVNEDDVDIRMGIVGFYSLEFLLHYRNVLDLVKPADDRGMFYDIPLAGFKPGAPLIQYRNKLESLAEFVDGYEHKARSNSAYDGEERKTKSSRRKSLRNLVSMGGATEEECTEALMDLHRYLERRLKGIPLTHIATVLAVSRIESWDNPYPAVGFDSQPADAMNGKRFVDHNKLIGMRSMSCTYLFERQQMYVDNIRQYTERRKPESIYDGAFVPYR